MFGFVAAGVAGLLAIGGAGAATAGTAAGRGTAAVPRWHVVKSLKTDFTGDFTAVVATGKTTAWAFDGYAPATGPTAWERSGATWKKVAFPGKASDYVVTAGATSASNVWAFTNNIFGPARALRWTGSKWSVMKTFPGQGLIGAASVVARNDVWVFGQSYPSGPGVWHYNGRGWAQVSKNLNGGSALAWNDAWAFGGTSVDHWNGHKWAPMSVKGLLPAKLKTNLNDPLVVGILARSDKDVYAIGNGNLQDEGGPVVVLHYNGTKWTKLAQGSFGYGPGPEFSSDGSGGLWLPMDGPFGGTSYLVHYAGGKLTKAAVPVSPATLTIRSVARVPGGTQQLAGGFTHASGNRGSKVVAVILQYS
jgi:hypothetical protein